LNIIVLIIAFSILAISCDSRKIYDQNFKISGTAWNKKKVLDFYVNIYDTIISNNVYINVRHSNLYSYSNLFLFLTIIAPDGNFIRDTVELTLADKSGKWLGKGLGDISDYQQIYSENVRFRIRGIYKFNIEQGMREDDLQNILDIGLRVEKSSSD